MGTDNTFVIARWDHPLIDLRVNSTLDVEEPDAGFSWSRPDGWQCYAPEGSFYGGELLPPVDEIRGEVGGPVLGLGLDGSHWEAAFTDDGGARWLAGGGGTEDMTSAQYEAAMVTRWGEPWQLGAAAALAAWASPFAIVDAAAMQAVLCTPYLWSEDLLFELQRTLTLVPEPGHPWWDYQPASVPSDEVPGSIYAVDANRLKVGGVIREGGMPERTVAVTFCETGVGIWDRNERIWLHDPDGGLDAAMEQLTPLLLSRGLISAS